MYRWWLGEREKPTIENESKIESESLELDTKDECGVEGGDNQSHGQLVILEIHNIKIYQKCGHNTKLKN